MRCFVDLGALPSRVGSVEGQKEPSLVSSSDSGSESELKSVADAIFFGECRGVADIGRRVGAPPTEIMKEPYLEARLFR